MHFQAYEDCSFASDNLTISLIDAFDRQTIQTPIKILFCKHLQCFSLENLVKSMENTFPRRWKCPLYKKKAFDFVVDGFLLRILQEAKLKHPFEIVYHKDGGYEVHEERLEEEKKNSKPFQTVFKESKPSSIPNEKEKVNQFIILDDDDEVVNQPNPKTTLTTQHLRPNIKINLAINIPTLDLELLQNPENLLEEEPQANEGFQNINNFSETPPTVGIELECPDVRSEKPIKWK